MEAPSTPLWAIACYFNPVGYRRRGRNYREFRRRLTVPLVTVELSFTGAFELDADDADILIQLRARDVMWQKERLLRIALQAVPREVKKVVWLDADIVFERDDWHLNAARSLDVVPLLQPFSVVVDLAPDADIDAGKLEPLQVRDSFCSALGSANDRHAFARLKRDPDGKAPAAAGMAWAFRRELLERHGFYTGSVLGGNDRAMACAAVGQFDAAAQNWAMNSKQIEHYRRWAEPFHADVQGRLGCVEGRLYHLWHGELSRRRYRERHLGLREHDFDPAKDVALDESSCGCWSSDKPEMHRYVKDYFRSRCEDDDIGMSCEPA